MSAANLRPMQRVHDLAGIGVGPFNLGLAALAAPVDGLDAVFLEQREFRLAPGHDAGIGASAGPFHGRPGHPGRPHLAVLIPELSQGDRPAVPVLHPGELLPAAGRIQPVLPVGGRPAATPSGLARRPAVTYADGVYGLHVHGPAGAEVLRARQLVLGTGTSPYVPEAVQRSRRRRRTGPPQCRVPARKDELLRQPSITIVGSGQSAAEIYYDLLEEIDIHGYQLNWVTRSGRFFPLEYTKLTLEMTSPEYVDYFHALPRTARPPESRARRTSTRASTRN